MNTFSGILDTSVHSALYRHRLKTDILAACIKEVCVAEKTYFRTMECWKYLDINSVGVMQYMINIGITIEEIKELDKEELKKKIK